MVVGATALGSGPCEKKVNAATAKITIIIGMKLPPKSADVGALSSDCRSVGIATLSVPGTICPRLSTCLFMSVVSSLLSDSCLWPSRHAKKHVTMAPHQLSGDITRVGNFNLQQGNQANSDWFSWCICSRLIQESRNQMTHSTNTGQLKSEIQNEDWAQAERKIELSGAA